MTPGAGTRLPRGEREKMCLCTWLNGEKLFLLQFEKRKKTISALLFRYIKSISEFLTFSDILNGVRSILSLQNHESYPNRNVWNVYPNWMSLERIMNQDLHYVLRESSQHYLQMAMQAFFTAGRYIFRARPRNLFAPTPRAFHISDFGEFSISCTSFQVN